jgi:fused signal recognition particle receptor
LSNGACSHTGKESFKVKKIPTRAKNEKITDPKELKELIVDELFIIYVNDEVITSKINFANEGPTIILFVGVNGVGKTTTIAKIASKWKKEGKRVLLVAADTFRAAAVEQLEYWAKEIGADVALIDTAGRLQNKDNLMKELDKIKRVTEKLTA